MKVNVIFPDSENLATIELNLPIIPEVFAFNNTFVRTADPEYVFEERKYWKPKLVCAVVQVHGTNDADRKEQWLNGYRKATQDNAKRYDLSIENAMDITDGDNKIDSVWYEVYVERTENPFRDWR